MPLALISCVLIFTRPLNSQQAANFEKIGVVRYQFTAKFASSE
jgi:hypothetical protein